MSGGPLPALLPWSVVLLWAAALTYFLLKSRRNYLALPELPSAPGPIGDVTVITPARNEEANIERVVRSLAPADRIVVDDHSTDATARLARTAGARVVSAPDLPAGWLGKPHACHIGAGQADTRWLLFVDADTWYEPAFLPSLIAYAEREQLESATVFLEQVCVTLPERLLLPYAFAMYFCGVNAANVNSPRSAEALANGQCLLVRRDAYQRIGGHAAVATSVIEDVAFASLAKQQGLKLRVLRAEQLGHVRMYDSFRAIWRGFQKNSFRFLLVNPWSGVQVIAASMLALNLVPVVLAVAQQQPGVALAFAFLPSLLLLPWYGGASALFAPLAIYLFQLIALSGMWTTLARRKTQWKGRPV